MGRSDGRDTSRIGPLSPTDFQVLLVLTERPLWGYAILKAVEEQSAGAISPEIGSLYRILARLMGLGLVEETDPPGEGAEAHPGLPRRYYRITGGGLAVARQEARRLEEVLRVARARELLPEGRS